MKPTSERVPRRREALSRDAIVRAAVEILDAEGEDALTLRALTRRMSTGYGAIYYHVANRDDLLAAAAEDVLGRITTGLGADGEPRRVLREVALRLFDAVVAHPWVGAQLVREPWRPALLSVYEVVGRRLGELGVPAQGLPDAASTLVNYIFGVAGQNAANARALAATKTDRATFLAAVAARWEQLDPTTNPVVHDAGAQLLDHDDRSQFLAGVDIVLAGIDAVSRTGPDTSARHEPGAP